MRRSKRNIKKINYRERQIYDYDYADSDSDSDFEMSEESDGEYHPSNKERRPNFSSVYVGKPLKYSGGGRKFSLEEKNKLFLQLKNYTESNNINKNISKFPWRKFSAEYFPGFNKLQLARLGNSYLKTHLGFAKKRVSTRKPLHWTDEAKRIFYGVVWPHIKPNDCIDREQVNTIIEQLQQHPSGLFTPWLKTENQIFMQWRDNKVDYLTRHKASVEEQLGSPSVASSASASVTIEELESDENSVCSSFPSLPASPAVSASSLFALASPCSISSPKPSLVQKKNYQVDRLFFDGVPYEDLDQAFVDMCP